ncbi:MAG: hypothetical protein R3D30_07670 [Hyphomicrobiales bacterium]
MFDFDSTKGRCLPRASKRDQILDFQPGTDLIRCRPSTQRRAQEIKPSNGSASLGSTIGKASCTMSTRAMAALSGRCQWHGKADFEIFVKIGSLAKGDFLL